MSSQPVVNPPVPFTGAIEGGFTPGKLLRLQGVTAVNCERFNVNLQTGPDGKPKDDISLHVSVRVAEGYVARNCCENGAWGSEEGAGMLPIYAGQRFELIILCEVAQYKVAINGRHFCDFAQRSNVPCNRVTHLNVDGDVQITLIVYESMPLKTANVTMNAEAQPLASEPLPAGFEPNDGSQFPQRQPGAPPIAPPAAGYYGPPQQPYFGGGGPNYYPQPMDGPGGYGPPPPPPGAQSKDESGLEGFLESASTALMGAIGSGAADKLIGLISGGGGAASPNGQQPLPQQQQQSILPQQQQQQQQPSPLASLHPSQMGGQGSIGGLGSVGSLLTSFAEDLLSGKKNQQH